MKKWVKESLIWTAYMVLFMGFIFPFFSGESIQPVRILISIPLFLTVGLLTGYFFRRKKTEKI
ncbi:MAG: hypothetical protein DI539_03195 [Flavobacterium psychrophilum]|nr:MAG: hypothetical protein DI539_03195 [Flavobacterium psychrophilum]